jgi:DNA-binding SARP family transcriptional activator
VKPRAVLAFLLLHPGELVESDRLLDELWDDPAPKTAKVSLRNQIAKLRKVLGHELLVTQGAAYSLRLESGELDANRFESLVQDARACKAEARAGKLREALSLWRGPAFSDFSYEPFAQSEIARLEELRLTALESRIDTDLTLGLHAGLVAELEALVARYPLRERFRAQLMLALYRCGRQSEALLAYRDARTMLHTELGLEPTESLRQLERAILVQDQLLSLEQLEDDGGSADVLEQVVSIAVGPSDRVDWLTEFGLALHRVGRFPSSDAVLSRAIEQAAKTGDARGEMRARLTLEANRHQVGRGTPADLQETATEAIALFESTGDDARIAEAWVQIAILRRDSGGSFASSTRALERALTFARRAGDRGQEHRILERFALNLTNGPCHALKAIERCEEIRAQVQDDAYIRARVCLHLAALYAIRGRFDEGRLLCAQSKETFEQLGLGQPSAWVAFYLGPLELLAGRPNAAEAELRASCHVLDSSGERGGLSYLVCLLARSHHDQGQYREADKCGRVSQAIAEKDDLEAQIPWRTARAAALAGLGSLQKAESFAREAVALAEPTDGFLRPEAHITLARVLAASGRYDDASASARRALALENRKGNIVAAKATRAFLTETESVSRRVARDRSGLTRTA